MKSIYVVVTVDVVLLFLLESCDGLCIPTMGSRGPSESPFSTPRRTLIGTVMAPVAWGIFRPSTTNAAEPVRSKDTDSLLAITKRVLRPKPLKVLRRKLSQDFAVLLMRSSYNALDELDCVAMDQFQRDFFLIRSSEYQDYTKALGNGMVQQGDLSDPYYFDFISFAQYQTINRELTQDPPFIFQEMQPGDQQTEDGKTRFVPVVVRRDPTLTNALLIPTHSSKVGSAILDRLDEVFGDTDSRIPKFGNKPDAVTLYSAIQQLVTLFLINGYAFQGGVTMTPSMDDRHGASGSRYVVSLQAPVILWGGRVLQSEGEALSNDFLLKTIAELLKRAGYESTSITKFEGISEEITIAIV